MVDDPKFHPADTNGDGVVSEAEQDMYLEFRRKELEDQDAQRDAMRKMTWFSLWECCSILSAYFAHHYSV